MKNYLQPKQILFGFELPNGDLLTPAQVAEVLDCTREHIYNLCAALALESINTAPVSSTIARYRIPRKVLIAFLEERSTGPFDADLSATEAPHDLALPEGRILRCKSVAAFLRCTEQHVCNLIDGWELLATDISLSKKLPAYRIPRAGLINYICTRLEGAY